jgi:hypothetical protein
LYEVSNKTKYALVHGEDSFTKEESGNFRNCRGCRDAMERVAREHRLRTLDCSSLQREDFHQVKRRLHNAHGSIETHQFMMHLRKHALPTLKRHRNTQRGMTLVITLTDCNSIDGVLTMLDADCWAFLSAPN